MSDTIITSRLEGTHLIVESGGNTETYDSQFLVAALMIFIARGSGTIEPEETAKMLDLIQEHFQLAGSDTLELLTRAMSELALSDADKEDIAVMALKVVAADGRRQVAEMEKFNQAVEAVGVSPEIVHRAFDRYFAETMTSG
jgi:uncharacterized tellurite resistance protein B-like protein